MAILDTYISDLLYQYDCVVIPGFGGFVANYRPAKIDAERGRFHPPGKDIGFNINLQKNDGLLSSFLCEKKKINPEEAATLIKNAVETYRYSLSRGEFLNFQNIGVLHLDKEKRMHFAPADEVNYLRSSFGLESFSLPRISIAQPETPLQQYPVRQFEPNGKTEETAPKNRSRWYWTAAALVPLLGFSYFALQNPESEHTTLAEIFSFGREKALYAPAPHRSLELTKNPISFPQKATFEMSFLPEATEEKIWVSSGVSPESTSALEVKTEGLLYHIIIGCFAQKQNAEELVEIFQKKGNKAFILDHHKGLYRVSTASFADFQTALSALSATKDGAVPKAWLLKKPI